MSQERIKIRPKVSRQYLGLFQQRKKLQTDPPVILAYPDFTKQGNLITDASNLAIGSVLSPNNRPIANYSRTHDSAEKNYSTLEKDLLAVVAH